MLIVGLGNPGKQYEETRHNVGFMAVDILSDRYNYSWSYKSKFNAEIAVGTAEHNKIILCKPITFMNLSGQAVAPIASYYKIPTQEIIVIHDDVDLEFGKMKCKIGGGHAGHNGLKSIDQVLGTNYYRIRIGIGRPENQKSEVHNFVLDHFSANEKKNILKKLDLLSENIELLINGNIEKFKEKIA